jgi:propionate CoA-transferase
MEFTPEISKDLKSMDARIFRPEPMGLAAIIAANTRAARSARLERIS